MPVTPCINEALPEEVLAIIFEEHAKLEWRAPVTDALVCQQWRRTIFRSPRVWAHIEIGDEFRSVPSEVRQQWLRRSGTAPLHVWVSSHWGLEEILDRHHKRIESLTVRHALARVLLEDRSFPILQSLTIYDRVFRNPELRSSTWDAMPALRYLRVGYISVNNILPSTKFPPLRVLALSEVEGCNYIIQNSYHSLTTLMLECVNMPQTSEILEFPSLSFLSLFAVENLKPRMSVPSLIKYHEGLITTKESFPMPLPLLTEYGIYEHHMEPLLNPSRLHQCYPNLSRVSIRSVASSVKAFLHTLSGQPTSLPMLKILAVAIAFGDIDFSREEKDSMMDDVSVRNTAVSVKMELCFDGALRVPLYFGDVRAYIEYGRVN